MNSLRVLLLLACALLAQGCGDRRQKAERQLRHGGYELLRHDAAVLYKDIFARHGRPDFIEVWYKDWPRSFQKLAPRHVGAYLDGLTIALATGDHGEAGLFVIPESMVHEPRDARGVTYRRLADGVYWYSFDNDHVRPVAGANAP